jgi:hypothetical protein
MMRMMREEEKQPVVAGERRLLTFKEVHSIQVQ